MTKNMKNIKYSIGLDIGTGSVGHAALDSNYNLMKYKGRYAWGSRLFDSAETAAGTRLKRGTRRGYNRRKNRIQLLQEIMKPTLEEYPVFFRQNDELEKIAWRPTNNFENQTLSEVLKEIGGRDYCKKYPTIYHLRHELFISEEQVDPRLVYLAIHNLTKFRGHFLYDVLDPSQGSTNEEESKEQLENYIQYSYELLKEDPQKYDTNEVWNILTDTKIKKAVRLENLGEIFGKKFTNIFFKLLLGGYKVKVQSIFSEFEDKSTVIDLSKEDSDDVISQLSSEQEEFIQLAQGINSEIILKNLLSGNKTVAEAKVKKYNRFYKQFKDVKQLIKNFDMRIYKEIFVSNKNAVLNYERHHSMEELCLFDKYRYQKKDSLGAKDALYKKLKTTFEKMDQTEKIKNYLDEIEEGILFERLNGVDNRAIPMQCSSYEAVTILKNQNYNQEIIEKVKALIEFRIPYYIGPLAKLGEKEERFSWSIRKEGMENIRVTPWNFDEVIDKDKSGATFINRMRNKCTYLLDEDTLPKYSLLYQEYEVLNELNGVSWMLGEKKTAESKFTKEEKIWIIKNIFKKTKTVTLGKIRDELIKAPFYHERNGSKRKINGTQKEDRFTSSLSSWIDFTNVFGEITETNYDMIENIILWLTLFTEKEIIERSIHNQYPEVTDLQINKILKLLSKYKGYGRLSKKLLNGIVDPDCHKTIIEHMREKPDVFMRVLHESTYEYIKKIEQENQIKKRKTVCFSYKDDVEPLQGSPAIKRSIWQTLKIVDEYVRLFGVPERIVIEMPREDNIRNKKKITKSREQQWEEIKKSLKGSKLINNVEKLKDIHYANERVWLYLHQNGKCMYSGESLDITQLDKYDVDHILPQRFVKDDSLDNKVLVLNRYNSKKGGDKLPLDVAERECVIWWKQLEEKKLISAKKLNNLMRTKLTDEDKMGFIARQLVETRQITKHIVRILENRFSNEDGEVKVVISTLKPDIISKLKNDVGIIKIREAGDKHHAVDAFVCAWLDRFMEEKYGRNIFQFEFGRSLSDSQKWLLANVLSTSENKKGNNEFFLFRDAKEWKYVNHRTGEVMYDAVPYFKKIVYDTPCQFTQRHVGTLTQFSNETIYSSKVNLKGGLNGTPFLNSHKSDRGLYSELKIAYMCVISYDKIIGKKVTKKTELVNVRVIEDIVYRKDKKELANYLCNQKLSDNDQAKGAYVQNCRINRIVERGQLVRSSNHLFMMKSIGEMNNALHLRMTEQELILCSKILTDANMTITQNDERIYEELKSKILKNYNTIIFGKLPEAIQKSTLSQENMLSLLRITKVGPANGKMFGMDRQTRYKKAIKLEDTVLIHQSITGLEVREEPLIKGK